MNFLDIVYSSTDTLAGRLRVIAVAAMSAADREREADAIRREIAERQPIERHDKRQGVVYGFDDDGMVTAVDEAFFGYVWGPTGRGATAQAAWADLQDAMHAYFSL